MNVYMKQAMRAYAKSFGNALETQISSAMEQIVGQMSSGMGKVMESAMTQIGQNLQSVMTDAMKIDTDAFAKAFQFNMTEDDLTELMMSMSGTASATYDSNLQKLGYADFAKPSEIDIYPKDFESKEQVVDYLDRYNKKMEKAGKDEQVISYTDVVGTLMSSVTDIVNTISYVRLHLWRFHWSYLQFNDRSHYVYQCAGAEERDRNLKGDRRIEEECISGV